MLRRQRAPAWSDGELGHRGEIVGFGQHRRELVVASLQAELLCLLHRVEQSCHRRLVMRDAAGSGLSAKADAWISTARPSATMNFVMVLDDMWPLLTHSHGGRRKISLRQRHHCTVVRTLLRSSSSLAARGGSGWRSMLGEAVSRRLALAGAVHRLLASASSTRPGASAQRRCAASCRSRASCPRESASAARRRAW